MIKVEYILDGQEGKLELAELKGVNSLELALSLHGPEQISQGLAEELLRDVMAILKPDVDTAFDMYASERGGERDVVSVSDKAQELGFKRLNGFFEDRVIYVI
ncbi:TPA: hypothetical protein I7241_20220 [Vibrio vulnificus]|nr:hypothetical protein [Vibrio vulnificus]HAS6350251.1 hypothetical protein [Vibrio vulnificus]